VGIFQCLNVGGGAVFPPTAVRVGFGLDKLAMRQTSIRAVQFPPIYIITPAFRFS